MIQTSCNKVDETTQIYYYCHPSKLSLTTTHILFQSPQWNKEQLFLYDVTIQIKRTEIWVAYTERTGKRLDLLLSYAAEKDYIGQLAILPLNERLNDILTEANGVHRFYVLIESQVHSLVPEVFFDKEQAVELLSAANTLSENDEVLINKLNAHQAITLFSLNRFILTLVQSKLKSAVLVHHTTALLQYLLINNQNGLSLFAADGFITLIRINNGKIEFINSFEAGTENDALYFILAAYEELGLNAEEKLTVYMAQPEQSVLFALLQKYIRQVQVADTASLNVSGAFVPLLTASQCE